jgi:hypothetical protein
MRLVQILDSLLSERLESLQSSSMFKTGLLLAHSGSQADTILHLIPTPSSDEDGGAAGSVDASWMVAHADAVSHMLPGGVAVLGAYLFSPSAKFSALEAQLRPVLAAALKRLKGVEEAQAVLLLLPTDARKASARVLASDSPSMRPLELKTTSTPPQVKPAGHIRARLLSLHAPQSLHLLASSREAEIPFCPVPAQLTFPSTLRRPCAPATAALSQHACLSPCCS